MRDCLFLSWQVVRRNWWVYRKNLIANISPTLVEPLFMILSLGIGLGHFIAGVEGRSYIQFLAPGLAVGTAMFTAFFETSYGFYVRMTFENVFKAMLTTPIGISEIIVGEFIWVAIKGAIMIVGVSLVWAAFGLFPHPINFLLLPLVGILTALSMGAVGLLASSYVKSIDQFQAVYAFLISPLYFFSGIFFPIEKMGPTLQTVAKTLPLYHSVCLSQSLFWNENVAETWLWHTPILLLYCAFFACWAYWRVRGKLEA